MKSIAEMYAASNQTATKPVYEKPTAGKPDWRPWKRPGAPQSIRDVLKAGEAASASPSAAELARPRFESVSSFFRR
jgi:hypothetical protein